VDEHGTLAGYMDGGEEQEYECRTLRGDDICFVHFYTPGTWRHADFCKTPSGHPGDCWEENNRVLGIKPGPAITIVDVSTGRKEEVW
jgi:hypothetical protein